MISAIFRAAFFCLASLLSVFIFCTFRAAGWALSDYLPPRACTIITPFRNSPKSKELFVSEARCFQNFHF